MFVPYILFKIVPRQIVPGVRTCGHAINQASPGLQVSGISNGIISRCVVEKLKTSLISPPFLGLQSRFVDNPLKVQVCVCSKNGTGVSRRIDVLLRINSSTGMNQVLALTNNRWRLGICLHFRREARVRVCNRVPYFVLGVVK